MKNVPENRVRFSVIIPAYNARASIGECLSSLGRQAISPELYEIIVVDDGSTDNTADMVANYDVNYIHQNNQGPASARNKGASLASGEIILFIDSDCVPAHWWLEEMLKPFEQNAMVSGVKGAYRTVQKSITARFAQAEFEDRYALLETHEYIDMVDTYSAAFNKKLFIEAGGFDETFPCANNEDTELSYRLAVQGNKFVFNPDAIVYHQHPESLFQYLRTKFWRGYWRMAVYAKYPGKAIKDTYTPNVLKVQTLLMLISLLIVPFFIITTDFFKIDLFLWSIIMLSTLQFSLNAFKKDKIIGFLSPFYILFRSFVFALGSVAGLTSCFIKKYITRIFI